MEPILGQFSPYSQYIAATHILLWGRDISALKVQCIYALALLYSDLHDTGGKKGKPYFSSVWASA